MISIECLLDVNSMWDTAYSKCPECNEIAYGSFPNFPLACKACGLIFNPSFAGLKNNLKDRVEFHLRDKRIPAEVIFLDFDGAGCDG